jgi:hypothetical protein
MVSFYAIGTDKNKNKGKEEEGLNGTMDFGLKD